MTWEVVNMIATFAFLALWLFVGGILVRQH